MGLGAAAGSLSHVWRVAILGERTGLIRFLRRSPATACISGATAAGMAITFGTNLPERMREIKEAAGANEMTPRRPLFEVASRMQAFSGPQVKVT